MALVAHNGRMYVYNSIRFGGKVTSRYVGSSPLVLALAALDAEEHERAEADRAGRRRLRELDRALDAVAAGVLAEARTVLEAAGYHQHARGHWRKQRGHRESTGTGTGGGAGAGRGEG
jgi:hypothetical protein